MFCFRVWWPGFAKGHHLTGVRDRVSNFGYTFISLFLHVDLQVCLHRGKNGKLKLAYFADAEPLLMATTKIIQKHNRLMFSQDQFQFTLHTSFFKLDISIWMSGNFLLFASFSGLISIFVLFFLRISFNFLHFNFVENESWLYIYTFILFFDLIWQDP